MSSFLNPILAMDCSFQYNYQIERDVRQIDLKRLHCNHM